MLDLGAGLTYTDIVLELEEVRGEVSRLDDDSLVEACYVIQNHIDGKEADKIERIVFKNHADIDLSRDERKFLKNVYVLHYCRYGMLIDEEDDDYADED